MMIQRRLFAEAMGSAMLSGTVIGSGILAERLAGGADAVALLANAVATGAMLFVLVTTLAPVSGAHFNPVVSMVSALRGELSATELVLYALVQVIGCVAGAILAHLMFELPPLQVSSHVRSGPAQMLSEGVAAFALVFAILMTARWRKDALPAVVALVIVAGYWWTASTSFANPAITIARSLSDTFAGIRPHDVPGFVVSQVAGGVAALLACRALLPEERGA